MSMSKYVLRLSEAYLFSVWMICSSLTGSIQAGFYAIKAGLAEELALPGRSYSQTLLTIE